MVNKRNGIENVGGQGKQGNATGFSWNLTLDGKVDVEGHNVKLHDNINLQSDSLIDVKQQFAERLFDSLGKSEKRKLVQLVHSTDVQIEKNLNMEDDLRKMEEEILELKKKYPKIKGDFIVKIKNLMEPFINIQEDLQQQQKYLKVYKILIVEKLKELGSLLDKAKEQGGSEKQKENMDMYKTLLGDEFLGGKYGKIFDKEVAGYSGEWGYLLSLHEDDAPWVGLNPEGDSYKIIKGEKYENVDGIGKITEAIENQILGKNVYDDNFANFALRFILEPFDVGGKYDEETLKYYVYSIIDCIKNTDVVWKILELYEKRKELEEKLKSLDVDLEASEKLVDEIKEMKKGAPIESDYSLRNLVEFKKSVFIELLEKDNKIGNGVFINDFVNQLRRSETYEDFVGNRLGELENIEDFGEQSGFLELFCNVLSFLGKQPPEDGGWKNRLRKLFYEMNNDFIGKEEISLDDAEVCLDNMNVWKNTPYDEEWKKLVGHDGAAFIRRRLRNIIKNKRDDVKVNREDSILFSNFKDICRRTQPWRKKPITLDERKSFINSCFADILGETVQDIQTKESDGDMTLMKNMINALINKINGDRKKICDTIGERLAKKQSENDILENLDMILQKSLGTFFSEFDCAECNEKSKKLKDKLKQLKVEFSGCKTMESYKVLEKNIKDFENNEDLKEFQGSREILNRCEDRESCDLSEINQDYKGIKWLLGLKKLFNSNDLSLEEKFDYSNVILKNIILNKNSKIISKKLEDDEILVSLFGEISVKRKDEKQTIKTVENIDNGSEYRQREIQMLDKLKSIESGDDCKFENFIEGLNGLGLDNSKVELERLEKELETLLDLLSLKKKDRLKSLKNLFPKSDDIEAKLRTIEKDKEKLELLKKSKKKRKLKELKTLFPESVNNEEELKKLKESFPEAVISYIDNCILENSLNFGKSLYAINYNTGNLDFSVIEAGILWKAVERGNVTNVLEYLGFRFDEGVDREKINWEVMKGYTDVSSTIKSIIQGYRQYKVGCFSDDYLTRGEGNAKLFADYVRSEGNNGKFVVGHGPDKFRFDGRIKDGGFVIEKYFSKNKDGENAWHDSHEDYINR